MYCTSPFWPGQGHRCHWHVCLVQFGTHQTIQHGEYLLVQRRSHYKEVALCQSLEGRTMFLKGWREDYIIIIAIVTACTPSTKITNMRNSNATIIRDWYRGHEPPPQTKCLYHSDHSLIMMLIIVGVHSFVLPPTIMVFIIMVIIII